MVSTSDPQMLHVINKESISTIKRSYFNISFNLSILHDNYTHSLSQTKSPITNMKYFALILTHFKPGVLFVGHRQTA